MGKVIVVVASGHRWCWFLFLAPSVSNGGPTLFNTKRKTFSPAGIPLRSIPRRGGTALSDQSEQFTDVLLHYLYDVGYPNGGMDCEGHPYYESDEDDGIDVFDNEPGDKSSYIVETTLETVKITGVAGNPGAYGILSAKLLSPDSMDAAVERAGGGREIGNNGVAMLYIEREQAAASATPIRFRKQEVVLKVKACDGINYNVTARVIVTPINGFSGNTTELEFGDPGGIEIMPLGENLQAKDGILEIPIEVEDGQKIEIVDNEVTLIATNAASAGTSSSSLSSANFAMQLGAGAGGRSAGFLQVSEDAIVAKTFTPSSLQLITFGGHVSAKLDSNGRRRQLGAPECIVDIVTLSATAYEVRFYERTQVAGVDPLSDLWTFSGDPFVAYVFQQGINADELVVSEIRGASVIDTVFRQDGDEWIGGFGKVGSAAPLQSETLAVDTEVNGDRIETREIRNPADNSLAGKSVVKIRPYPFGEKIIEEVDGDNITSTVSVWYDNPATDGLALGQLKSRQRSDGYWETWEYDSQGRRSKRVRQHLDSAFNSPDALNRVTVWTYATVADMDDDEIDEPLSGTIDYLLGQEVSRRYRLELSAVKETDSQRWKEERQIVATQPGALWNAPTNQVTIVRTGQEGLLKNRDLWRENPDGTVMRLTLEVLGTGDLKWTTSEGALEPGGNISGRRTVVLENSLGRELARDSYEDDVLMESSTVTQMDGLGRPLVIEYQDGTEESFSYNCCNLASYIGRDGIETAYTYDGLKRRKTQTRAGITETYSYDAAGRVTGVDIAGGSSSIAVSRSGYDTAGRLLWEEDAMGRLTTHAYSASGTYGEIHTTTFAADGSTVIETMHQDGSFRSRSGTAAIPEIATYGVGTAGLRWVQRIAVGEGGSQAQWVRDWTDMTGNLVKREYAGGAEELYAYDDAGRLVSQTDADGVRTLFAYNDRGERTVAAVDLNRNGIIDYNGEDRITRTTREAVLRGSVAVYRTKTEVWEENNVDTPVVISENDVSGNQRQAWDTTYGLTSTMAITYNGLGGSVQTVTNADGSYVVSTFDEGRLLSVVQKTAGNVTIGETLYSYDALGRLQSQTIPDQQTVAYTYYADGQQQSVTVTPLVGGLSAQTTSYLYDGRGRISEVTLPDASKVHTTYYPTGSVKRTWGSGTYPVEYTYDPQGRMRTMTTWKDFSGESGASLTTWNYDAARGWLLNKQYADDEGPSYTYTGAGRLATRTWARGVVTTYGYNNAGDLSSVAYSDATPAVAHTYDRLGRQWVTTDAAGTLTRSYENGALKIEVYSGSGVLSGKSLTRTFDALNRVSTLAASGGYNVGYTYDGASRLATVTGGSLAAEYTYHPQLSRILGVMVKNGGTERARVTRTLDGLGRVSRIDTLGNGTTLHARRDYTYDSLNRATRIEQADARRWVYDYDALGQVTLAEKRLADDTTVQPGYAFGYNYDDIGNRTQATANGRTAAYASNMLNQYTGRDHPGAIDVRGAANLGTSVLVNDILATRTAEDFYAAAPVANESSAQSALLRIQAVDVTDPAQVATVERSLANTLAADPFIVPARAESFQYDADGNLTQDGRWNYIWDGENRLLRVEMRTDVAAQAGTATHAIENVYDSQGRRVQVVESILPPSSGWMPISDKIFLYDGWNLLVESDSANSSQRNYVWGIDASGTLQGAGGVGGLLWATADSQTHAAGYDANGNIIAWVNVTDGTLSGTREYGAFGENIATTGVGVLDNWSGIPFGFSTKYQDRLTGHYYYGYRFYDASTGRWLGRDSIGEKGGLNLYGFVGNNGVNSWDMLGMADFKVVVKSFIGPIGKNIGSLHVSGLDQMVREDNLKWAGNEDGRLALMAGIMDFLMQEENPETDAMDRGYRLFTQVDIVALGIGAAKILVSPDSLSSLDIKTDTGKEGFLSAPALSLHNVKGVYNRSCTSYRFGWTGRGRPHFLAKTGMSSVVPRANSYISHYFEGEIEAESEDKCKVKLKVRKFGGSAFPRPRGQNINSSKVLLQQGLQIP